MKPGQVGRRDAGGRIRAAPAAGARPGSAAEKRILRGAEAGNLEVVFLLLLIAHPRQERGGNGRDAPARNMREVIEGHEGPAIREGRRRPGRLAPEIAIVVEVVFDE